MRRCYGLSYQLIALVVSTLLTACGGGGGGGGGSVTAPPPVTNNVVSIIVNGGLNGNVNQAFVTLTVCRPGTSQCQTIDHILVDTGSMGLRLIPSALGSLTLPQQTAANGNPLAECVGFVDNSHAWGPVQIADIKMADEVASSVSIQLITSTSSIGPEPVTCGGGDTTTNLSSSADLGGNGILGIGNFPWDCGSRCGSIVSNGLYYQCQNGCSDSLASTAIQVQNPIAKFPQDNNGSIIDLPAISNSGAVNVSGSLIFGINTRSNNQLGSAAPQYLQSDNGRISTTYNGRTYRESFIDSGSNGLYFPNIDAPLINECMSPDPVGFYCPPSTISRSATLFGDAPSGSVNIVFNVADAGALNGNFSAFNDLGGRYDGGFDWGLPFFYGRKVYTSIYTMPGITTPYVAF